MEDTILVVPDTRFDGSEVTDTQVSVQPIGNSSIITLNQTFENVTSLRIKVR